MKAILTQFRRLIPYLPASARHYLLWYAVLSAVLSVVDVVTLMLLAALLSAGVGGITPELPIIGAIPADRMPLMILVLSAIVILKSGIGLIFQWRATRHFAAFDLSVGDHLFRAYISAPWTERMRYSTSRVVQMTSQGVGQVVAQFLFPLSNLPGMLVTMAGVVIMLVVQQPLTALITTIYLGGIAFLQYAVLQKATRQAARVMRDQDLKVGALLAGMMSALKEIALRGKEREVSEVVYANRSRLSRARANRLFLGAIPRFVFDSAVIGGFIITGAAAFLRGGMPAAISAIALFGIAGFRLVPSLSAFQSIITGAVSSLPVVDTILGDIERSHIFIDDQQRRLGTSELPSQIKDLELTDVSYTYPGALEPAVREVSLDIPMGSSVGIVGGSGAGKSTLVDVLLGLLTPSGGEIAVDGISLDGVFGSWRSRVGYVPQEVALFDGTIEQNVALTWGDDIDSARVERALRRAQLWDVVESRPGGVKDRIGERGLTLSGGQKQRLGIARALYPEPLVLVLDEATSALDTKTEADVAKAINELAGDVTVISVAHRLSTIRHADQILFMRDGMVVSRGTFDELVATDAEFARLAALAGLAGADAA